MDFEYSPHRSAGGTMHLLSPTHHSQYVDSFSSIKQIRRSLSRSPSKPSRFQIYSMKSPKQTQTSPHSPSALSRAVSAETGTDLSVKPKFSLRRAAPMKAPPRKTSPNSPMRRALSDSVSQSNTASIALPFRGSATGQENVVLSPAVASKSMRFELDNEPIKFDLLKAHADKPSNLNAAMRDHLTPAKSSPLKRSDGVMNLDQPTMGSPRAKRRSLHAAAFGNDFNVFELGFDGNNDLADASRPHANEPTFALASPRRQKSPQRRPFSLRKSTLQQRTSTNTASPRSSLDGPESPAPSALVPPASPALLRSNSRMSLDSVLPLRSIDPMTVTTQAHPEPSQPPPKPHPLSKTLSPSSSGSNLADESLLPVPAALTHTDVSRPYLGFSKSLPIGAVRPRLDMDGEAFQSPAEGSFETPELHRMARPLPTAFMSTGLISKRNRNADLAPAAFGSSVNMPDTPSKKTFLPSVATTPAHPSVFGAMSQPKHEFGSPTTPFSPHVFKGSPESFGKGVSIFGSRVAQGKLVRRSSFLSIEGDDSTNNSPTAKLDSQVSTDDLPPTPTKPANTGPRPQSKGRGNSLRSSLLGRRSSLAPDTFVAPEAASSVLEQQRIDGKHSSVTPTPRNRQKEDMIAASRTPFITFTPSNEHPSPSLGRSRLLRLPSRARSPSPLSSRIPTPLIIHSTAPQDTEVVMQTATASAFREGSLEPPVTPSDYAPPDASRLSISGEQLGHNVFASNRNSFPPATPTGPRDQPFNFSISQGAGGSSMFQNDVDTTLTARFGNVHVYGNGEFSIVYRVEAPLPHGPAASLHTPNSVGKVWAVKKSKKPYAGSKDRSRKMKEVQILKALRGSEHIIESVDTWEMKNHLYIQTEFCENGNLKDFLSQAGYKARVDDFRIWKILLELSQGIESIHRAGYIHLDLKPANVFIDWEGVLKIGDFGMASVWPAPPHLDGEGDREYIAPEALSGRFDKPADLFSLGMIMLEIAGNIVLPDNGVSWQRLRAGDMSDLPSLTFSSDSSLVRDESGDPVSMLDETSKETLRQADFFDDEDDDLGFCPSHAAATPRARDLVQPPSFMVDPNHADALEKVLHGLMCPNPDDRPTIEQVLGCGGVEWVARRRRAGATIYEGNWGPADDVLSTSQDVEMLDI